MAKIIYKDGCEGQNRLKGIEGIEIGLLNGQKALIYPKYGKRALLNPKYKERWHDVGISETAALRLRDNKVATTALLGAGSPAAGFVSFVSEKFGRFGLPTLLAAMEITEQRREIDELAKNIEGADLLKDFHGSVWSCSRYSESYGWAANGSYGFADGISLSSSNLSVPLVLLSDTAHGVA